MHKRRDKRFLISISHQLMLNCNRYNNTSLLAHLCISLYTMFLRLVSMVGNVLWKSFSTMNYQHILLWKFLEMFWKSLEMFQQPRKAFHFFFRTNKQPPKHFQNISKSKISQIFEKKVHGNVLEMFGNVWKASYILRTCYDTKICKCKKKMINL